MVTANKFTSRTRIGCICFSAIVGVAGLGCQTDNSGTLPPPIVLPPNVDRPPVVAITEPINNITVEAGDKVIIRFAGGDAEETARVTILVDADRIPNSGNEIVLKNDFFVGPGDGDGQVIWDTTGVPSGTYVPFAKINDGVNPEVLAAGPGAIQVVPSGTNPLPQPPEIQFLEPLANLGLASGDTLSVRYRYRDVDSRVRITLVLDKDQDPSNDDINNPGDPNDPATNIIILPSGPRQPNDPVLPSTVPGQPPLNDPDNIEIRKNPRDFESTPTGAFSEDKLYVFTINFAQIPIRKDGLPYFLRASIVDADGATVHQYATGSLTITGLAQGFVDLQTIGVDIAGARVQGFNAYEQLGSLMLGVGDLDNDTNDDFIIVGRFGSPRNRPLAGVAYLVRGRRKLPYPPDTNTNGLPDTLDTLGNTVDFPLPPIFVSPPFNQQNPQLALPYRPEFVGRFGGVISSNSIGFRRPGDANLGYYRGVTYAMPQAHATGTVPAGSLDTAVPNVHTSGLTSVTVGDYCASFPPIAPAANDGIPDLVFGMPYISGNYEFHDDDPCDAGGRYADGFPNADCDSPPSNDDIGPFRGGWENGPINQGSVFVVDGTNDVENDGNGNGVVFGRFLDVSMAGQFDPAYPTDDENKNLYFQSEIPVGLRIRGGWYGADAPNFTPPVIEDNEYGYTVARMPSWDNDQFDELMISVPNDSAGRGRIDIWLGENYLVGHYADTVLSLPSYVCAIECVRTFVLPPNMAVVRGATSGDRFGFARAAGQFNQDGTIDVLCGSPNASRDGLTQNGISYVLFTPQGGFGSTQLPTVNIENGVVKSEGGQEVPRVEIHGTHNGDRFGEVHDDVGDINGDGIDDIAIASKTFDDDSLGNAHAGFVGVIYGFRPLTGERVFFPTDIGTGQLTGVKFFGATIGAMAGASISAAGDFNRDGFGDLLIASPGEVRRVGDQNRLGVAYLIFGGPHLTNKSFNLSQVGSPDLPGIVFVSRYAQGSADEAPIDTVAGIGDIDSDGFADIALGAPHADFVDPLSPNQRRNDAGECYIVYGSNFGSNKLPEKP